LGKIYAFVIMLPLAAMMLLRGVTFFEYDTKTRYITDYINMTAYKVKLTGELTQDDYNELKSKLNTIARFNDSGIILKKAKYMADGSIGNVQAYTIGEKLIKGDLFMIYVKSSDVSNFSKASNFGVSQDDGKNLYYKAKAVVRIEKYDSGQ